MIPLCSDQNDGTRVTRMYYLFLNPVLYEIFGWYVCVNMLVTMCIRMIMWCVCMCVAWPYVGMLVLRTYRTRVLYNISVYTVLPSVAP